jgi:UDP-N-acetylmuramate--alanine ligase
MSALAQLLLALGHAVSGSDRHVDQGHALDIFAKLRLSGLHIMPQDGAGVHHDLQAVVVSSAIEADNPDLVAARKLGITIIHRAELLARLSNGKKVIAVTGTAGKTTVTGMLGWTLEQLGLDPTVVNGGAVINWIDEKRPGNFRFGRSELWVLELDESDRSLLYFSPHLAVITNVSQDHFALDELKNIFSMFSRQVKEGVVGLDTVNWCGLGTEELHPKVTAQEIAFQYHGVDFALPLPGGHNIENALHCAALCEKLGLHLQDVSRALSKFGGIERRLQIVGRAGGIIVIDDYAHNPAKISAAWQAVASFAGRIVAVWRPHGYAPLALMYKELLDIFPKSVRTSDILIIMEVYYAGGTAKKEITGRMLADELSRRGMAVDYAENYQELQAKLEKFVKEGDTVLFMGARDPELPVFARRFVLELDNLIMHRAAGSRSVTQKNQSAHQAENNRYKINQ